MTVAREACSMLEQALGGDFRALAAAGASRAPNLGVALHRVGVSMRSHDWRTAAGRFHFGPLVRELDRRTRSEGLHVLHDWDGQAGRTNEDTIPVDVLEFIVRVHGDQPHAPGRAATLIDYYFLYLLALLSVRAWDEGDPDTNLDEIDRLLALLQGPGGSGQPFLQSAAALILIATSHYEPVERGYDLLLERVRTLAWRHRIGVAASHAAAIGCHLRFGFEATYGRDTSLMRQDNGTDYPWLCFSLSTLMQEYLQGAGAAGAIDRVVEPMLNGLSADARAFVGEPPSCLASCAAERERFLEAFHAHRGSLLDAFERLRPSDDAYSPLAFFFNFSQNVQKGTVVDAVLRGRPWAVALEDLFAARPARGAADSPRSLAMTLMGYARAAPDRIRGRPTPAIVYDPVAGRMAFSVTMRKLRQ